LRSGKYWTKREEGRLCAWLMRIRCCLRHRENLLCEVVPKPGPQDGLWVVVFEAQENCSAANQRFEESPTTTNNRTTVAQCKPFRTPGADHVFGL
jgi:hypothetical protein